jgi:two-component system, OmpR family, response regulator ResD
VWGWTFGDQSTVTVHVRRLREKVEDDPAAPTLIQTVWGIGYRLELPQ